MHIIHFSASCNYGRAVVYSILFGIRVMIYLSLFSPQFLLISLARNKISVYLVFCIAMPSL